MTRGKNSRILRKLAAALLAVFVFATAAPTAEAEQTGSVILSLKNTNVTFYVYQVGLLTNDNDVWRCDLTDAFSGSALSLSDLENASVSLAKAAWLKNYVDSHQIEPYRKGVSDSSGKISFSDMEEGLYLFIKTDDTESRVHVAPFLLTMPLKNPEGTGWIYDFAAIPKSEETKPDYPDRPDDGGGGGNPPGPSPVTPKDDTLIVNEPDIPLATIEVPGENVPLATLPKTGGDMTAIFCACGGVLLIMGGIVSIVAGACQPAYTDSKKRVRSGKKR